MKKLNEQYLGATAMTKREYMAERGEKNGHPVNWKPEHRHRPLSDQNIAPEEKK